jgi:hypothetical protein
MKKHFYPKYCSLSALSAFLSSFFTEFLSLTIESFKNEQSDSEVKIMRRDLDVEPMAQSLLVR